MSNFITDLGKANNMQEFLDICGQHYDLKNAKLGFVTKGVLIANIDKIIKMSGAKPIKK